MDSTRRERGFTLVEIVVVMAVLAILALIIIGAIMIARRQADNTKLRADAKTIRDLNEAYIAKNKTYVKNGSTGYSRIDGYTLFSGGAPSTPGKANNELKDFLNNPDNPPVNTSNGGKICYTHTGTATDYFLWIIPIENSDLGCSSGFWNTSIGKGYRIHCPKGTANCEDIQF